MILISEQSSGGPLVDWVPEGHDRKYTELAAMSIRIAATPPAWLTLMREGRRVSAPLRPWRGIHTVPAVAGVMVFIGIRPAVPRPAGTSAEIEEERHPLCVRNKHPAGALPHSARSRPSIGVF